MDLNDFSIGNSILEKIKTLLPTTESDFSSPETDEVTIFQTPAGHFLKLPKDLDSFLEDDAELQEQVKHGRCCQEDIWRPSHGDGAVHNDGQLSDVQIQGDTCGSRLATGDSELDSTKREEGSLVLSFERLDEWDLDAVLQNLQNNGKGDKQLASTEPGEMHAEGDSNNSLMEKMEKIIALLEMYSAPQVMKNSNSIRENTLCEKPLEDMAAQDSLTEPAKRASDCSSESPIESGAQQETPLSRKHKTKLHTGSHMHNREATGKSVLLQKIREANLNVNKSLKEDLDHSEDEKQKHQPSGAGESAPSCDSQPPQADQQLSAREPPLAVGESSVKKPKKQREQKGPKVKQMFEHKEIFKQLEKHRPTRSVNLKQPAAEHTDVLYDPEVSHLEPISTLPVDTESKGCMLLTVQLSSPGMVGDRAPGRRKLQSPAAVKAHVYNTLLAWFLSLTDSNCDCAKDEAEGAKVPFWVAGLQQLWTEGGLALHILVVARHCYTTRKRDVDVHTPFYNHVSRFLSETSLPVIATWLPQLKDLLERQPYASPVHLPSSCLNCFVSATSNKAVIDKTFGVRPGFYWQTVETQEQCFKGKDTAQEVHPEVSVLLGHTGLGPYPFLTHYILHLVFDAGLDVCGVRLLYPPQWLLVETIGRVSVNPRAEGSVSPVLALALRGPHARSLLKDWSSFLSHLTLGTTPQTFTSCFCLLHQEHPSIHSPEETSRVHRDLCMWFSGRVSQESEQNLLNRVPPQSDKEEDSQISLSRSFLCATTKADVLLMASPLVPPCCYGDVLALCEHRGFSLRGLRRVPLQSNEVAVLGLTNHQAAVFCSPPPGSSSQEQKLPPHCLMLLLRKENVQRHSATLPSALMRVCRPKKPASPNQTSSEATVEPSMCFHTVAYNNNLHQMFVKCMWAVPDPSSVILTHHKCPLSSDMEQMVVLTLSGPDMGRNLSILHRVLIEGAEGDEQHIGLELLGLKWLPALTQLQAQELSPYEVGEQLSFCTVDALMSSPALLCALRGIDAYDSLRKLLAQTDSHNPSVLMSPTPIVALRQSALFFFQHEIIAGRQMLLSVCLLKPSVWNDSLATILGKLVQCGLTLVALRVVTLDQRETAPLPPGEGVDHLNSGSSMALCLQGENALKRLLHVLGQEDSSMWRICYGSRSYRQAVRDVKMYFPEGLCCTETSTMSQAQIPSLCSDPVANRDPEQRNTLIHSGQESLSAYVASGAERETEADKAHSETTCLLIPLNAPPPCNTVHSLETVEQLLKSGCHLVAGRMTVLNQEQWKCVAGILAVKSKGAGRPDFHSGPWLIVALQGEQIVTRLSSRLTRIYKERSDLEKLGKTMIYPESEEEAKQLVCFLFPAS